MKEILSILYISTQCFSNFNFRGAKFVSWNYFAKNRYTYPVHGYAQNILVIGMPNYLSVSNKNLIFHILIIARREIFCLIFCLFAFTHLHTL